MAERTEKRKSKRARRRAMRRAIPIIVAVVLIIIVAAVGVTTGMIRKMSYSSAKADLNEYFNLTTEEDTAVLIGREFSEEHAICRNGKVYIPQDMAEQYLCNNFYYDKSADELLYTDATAVASYGEDSGDFIVKNETMYMSLDMLSEYSETKVNVFTSPNHIEICDQEPHIQLADVTEDTQVRILGGIKSDILTEVKSGDSVEIINPMDDWCSVKTADGFIGYVENKYLDNYRQEDVEIPSAKNFPEIEHTLRDHKICMGWHQVTSEDANSAILDVIKDNSPMNVISPTWFSLADNEGNITSIAAADYVETAHEHGIEVWALTDNFGENINTYDILSDTGRRNALTKNIIDAALSAGVDGINIDFENLPTECGPSFAQFIREISIPCRQNSLVLSVDNYVPQGYTEFYHRDVQGAYADYVIIMGYDEHYAGSDESGSVASFDFVQEGIEKTLEDVPADQVINGIPFYTRIWQESNVLSSEAVSMEAAQQFAANHGMNLEWNDACAQYYGETQEDGVTYKVWMEDVRSIKAKLDLMQSNDIAGVACWKLGFETSDIWDVIGEYIGN